MSNKTENKKQPSFLKAASVEEMGEKLMIPNETIRFEAKDIDRILIHAYENGVSDISLQPDLEVIFQIYGKIVKVSKHKIDLNEMQNFINHIHGESGVATLNSGKPLNEGYFIRDDYDMSKYYRFRVNSTKHKNRGSTGYQITARVIPSEIPYLSDMKLPKDLEHELTHFSKGIALITGATGSGKSTLLASIIAEFLRNDNYHKKILTAEEPIEFTYENINSKHSFISQSEIPKDIPSFAAATANALRRAPNIILIGEARDVETIREAGVAAMTGHEVYTTVHSNGFMDTFRRMVDMYSETEKAGAAAALISNTKVVLSQRLVPSVDGKRVALREYVILNDRIREILLLGGPDKLTYTCKKVLDNYGHSFAQDAEEKYAAGLISQEVYESIISNSKAVDKGEEENAIKENMQMELIEKINLTLNALNTNFEVLNKVTNELFSQKNRLEKIEFAYQEKYKNDKKDDGNEVELNF